MPPKQSASWLEDFEDEATLYSLSAEFLEAASVLSNTPPIRVNYTLVTFYLLGHAAELLLKSYLFQHGVSLEDLRKKYGHDLGLLIEKARSKGLPLSVSTEYLQSFASAYARKRTEYRRKQELHLPPPVPI